jgi:hypothetical protein
VKVNVDAAVFEHGNRGITVAICWDERGFFLGASVLVVQGISDPPKLEATCREGLALGGDLSVNRMLLASDCLEFSKAVKEKYRCNYYSVRDRQSEGGIRAPDTVTHELRTSNKHVHNLACSFLSLDHGSPFVVTKFLVYFHCTRVDWVIKGSVNTQNNRTSSGTVKRHARGFF